MANTSKITFSVITPCYNGAAFIADCIGSGRAQTFGDWEMLVIDDCSTDDSAEIIRRYAEEDARIKYLCTPARSGGPSLPRNMGIDHAQGEFIAFLDSDDMWLPRKLEEQYRFLTEGGCEFVYSNYEKISHDGRRRHREVKVRASSSYRDMLASCDIPCLTAVISRRLIGETRFRQIPKEDYAMWLDILKKGAVARNTGIVHALYRETPDSRSSDKLAMVRNHWFVLRSVEGVGVLPALYFTLRHLVKGVRKYII